MDRTILHCDLNSFYASVECVRNPSLKDVPMAVCGSVENRHGIILAKNELAKKFGIVTAETVWQAQKKCPDLVLVPPNHHDYERYSCLVNKIYETFTDMVEPFGIDESWLDVTGSMHVFGSGKEIANKIRQTVKSDLGLSVSVGVSFNKVFAKLGSDYKKPDATTVITRENFEKIVFPLPVTDLLFVGKASASALSKLSISTIGQLARFDKGIIISKLGKMGGMIHDYANGINDDPVRFAHEHRRAKSIGNGMTFKRDLVGIDDIKIGVLTLSDTVATRLREAHLKCQTIQVMIKDTQFKSISRQKKLNCPTHLSRQISDAVIGIIKNSWNLSVPIRTITIAGKDVVSDDKSEQLSLFDVDDGKDKKTVKTEKFEKIESAVDKIRNRYGKGSIALGTTVHTDLGIHKEDFKDD